MTRTQGLLALAEANVITEARLADALVRTEDDLRAAKRELTEARIQVGLEAMVSA